MSADYKEYMREYMRQYRAEGRDKSRLAGKNMTQPFVGVDGEGGNLDNGYHAYFLLRVGDRSLTPSAGNLRLGTKEIFEFLVEQPRDRQYVVYFGDYDVTKMLEDVGWYKLDRLIHRDVRARQSGGHGLWPIDWDDYEFDYLPRKEFKLRRKGEEWLYINDVGSFFQAPFVTTLEKWSIGTEAEREAIAAGKEKRGNFEISQLSEIDEYNQLEIVLLGQLMEKFRETCSLVGYVPNRWQGPGLLAEAMFRKHGVKPTSKVKLLNDPTKAGLLEFAQNAFYGGRPEVMAIGPIDRPVNQFDINSAYPYAMQFVPCLEHGLWTYREGLSRTRMAVRQDWPNVLTIEYGCFEETHSNEDRYPFWYGLPVRTETGTITYPAKGRGWYWGHEIDAAKHQVFHVEKAWTYQRLCDCRPLGFVSDVYAERQRVGKDDAGIVLKLALNSLYGKTVQSIGSPKYSNPIWGSFITATCRAMIQDFIHSSEWCTDPKKWCGNDVVMVATDSVATWNPRTDIPLSKDLGGWSKEEHPGGMFIVQPGVYFGTSGKPIKTRGVPRSVLETMEETFRSAFDRMVREKNIRAGDVNVPQRLFAGIRYTLHRHNQKLLGQWIEFKDKESGKTGKTISFDWSSKRAPWPALDPLAGAHSYIQTFPPQGSVDVETVPYSKNIGGLLTRDDERLVYEDQPDWSPIL